MKDKQDKTEETKELKASQQRFCEEYIFDFNGTRSYQVAYPDCNYDTARTNAARLLANAHIQAYIKELQADLGKTAGISRLRVLREHEKLAFSSIAHLHNTWVTRKEFEELTDDQKSCIAEIATQTRTETKVDLISKEKTPIQVDYVKIKLYDKQKSLDSINKMLGFNEPEKVDHTSKGESIFGAIKNHLTGEADDSGE